MKCARIRAWAGLVAGLGMASTAPASFHFWGINEVYSNASGTIQFIEMATSSSFEQFLQFNQFTSNTQTLTFDHNFAELTGNKTFLMATPAYAALPGVPAPDFVFPVNNFFSITGDTLTLVFGEGDGVHPPTLTFTSGQLPTDGTQSMKFDKTLNAVNSPQNFAGATGTVPEPSVLSLLLGLLLVPLRVTSRQRAVRRS